MTQAPIATVQDHPPIYGGRIIRIDSMNADAALLCGNCESEYIGTIPPPEPDPSLDSYRYSGEFGAPVEREPNPRGRCFALMAELGLSNDRLAVVANFNMYFAAQGWRASKRRDITPQRWADFATALRAGTWKAGPGGEWVVTQASHRRAA